MLINCDLPTITKHIVSAIFKCPLDVKCLKDFDLKTLLLVGECDQLGFKVKIPDKIKCNKMQNLTKLCLRAQVLPVSQMKKLQALHVEAKTWM